MPDGGKWLPQSYIILPRGSVWLQVLRYHSLAAGRVSLHSLPYLNLQYPDTEELGQ